MLLNARKKYLPFLNYRYAKNDRRLILDQNGYGAFHKPSKLIGDRGRAAGCRQHM